MVKKEFRIPKRNTQRIDCVPCILKGNWACIGNWAQEYLWFIRTEIVLRYSLHTLWLGAIVGYPLSTGYPSSSSPCLETSTLSLYYHRFNYLKLCTKTIQSKHSSKYCLGQIHSKGIKSAFLLSDNISWINILFSKQDIHTRYHTQALGSSI